LKKILASEKKIKLISEKNCFSINSGVNMFEDSIKNNLSIPGLPQRFPPFKPDPLNSQALQLQDEQYAQIAVLKMLLTLVEYARLFEQGIVENTHVEFLHQYRVILRRARSLLSRMKDLFLEKDYLNLKGKLRCIFTGTNTLRDLDVFMQGKGFYYNALPASLHPGLDNIFDVYKTEQDLEQKRVSHVIAAKAYKKDMKSLKDDLRKMIACKDKKRNILKKAVQKQIRISYEKVLKRLKKINGQADDSKLHKLRISAKKLRYLIELFGWLFKAEHVFETLTELKSMQDKLGRFNDLSVQGIEITGFADRFKEMPKKTASALEGMQVLLKQEKERLKNILLKQLTSFSAKKLTGLINKF